MTSIPFFRYTQNSYSFLVLTISIPKQVISLKNPHFYDVSSMGEHKEFSKSIDIMSILHGTTVKISKKSRYFHNA